jgi:hypothetical protein
MYPDDPDKQRRFKGHMWRSSKDGYSRTGFEHGEGWNAYADDFPVGTVIRVLTTVEIELPEED